jgi:hypothetical protein
MKLPEQINICGRMYKVKANSKHNGGNFSEAEQLIEIGTQWPADIPENLLHESIEGIMSVRGLRYSLEKVEPDNGDYMFIFNHAQYEQLIKDIATALHGINFNEKDKK